MLVCWGSTVAIVGHHVIQAMNDSVGDAESEPFTQLGSLVEFDPSWSMRRSPVVLTRLPLTQTDVHSLCRHCKRIQGFSVFSRQESLTFNRRVSPRMHLCHLQEPRPPLFRCQHLARLMEENETLTRARSPPTLWVSPKHSERRTCALSFCVV